MKFALAIILALFAGTAHGGTVHNERTTQDALGDRDFISDFMFGGGGMRHE